MNKSAEKLPLLDFFKLFRNEEAAQQFIKRTLWSDNVMCPHCQSYKVGVRVKIKGYRCKSCRKDFNVRTGTIFKGSNLPLNKWLYAMYLLQTSKESISSLQLSKELGITQKSAWFLCHRIRKTYSQDNTLLSGIAEASEIYSGGKKSKQHKNKMCKETKEYSEKIKGADLMLRDRGSRGQIYAKRK